MGGEIRKFASWDLLTIRKNIQYITILILIYYSQCVKYIECKGLTNSLINTYDPLKTSISFFLGWGDFDVFDILIICIDLYLKVNLMLTS